MMCDIILILLVPLCSVSSANFYPVTVQNSSMLPLTFVFELNEAIPLCSLVRDELVTICGTGM